MIKYNVSGSSFCTSSLPIISTSLSINIPISSLSKSELRYEGTVRSFERLSRSMIVEDNIVIEKEQRTDYLPKRSADKLNQNIITPPAESFSENRVEISDTALDVQSEENEVVSEYPINQPELISSKPKRVVINSGAFDYEDGNVRNPYEVSKELVSDGITPREDSQFNARGASIIESKLPRQTVKSPSEDFSENGSDQVEVSSNAAFYYDIGRRYFISSQYELSKRYINLAFENGYRSDDLKRYLSEIEKRLDPNSQNSRSLVKSIQNETRKIGQRALPRYEYDPEKAGPAVESGALEFDTSNKERTLSLGTENQRNRALEEFYSEMEKMEAELRQYTKKKRHCRWHLGTLPEVKCAKYYLVYGKFHHKPD